MIATTAFGAVCMSALTVPSGAENDLAKVQPLIGRVAQREHVGLHVAEIAARLLDVGREHGTGNRTGINPFRRLNLIACRASNLADASVAHQVRARHVRALTGC